MDVNPPVTVRANSAKTAAGTHQSLTGQLTSTARHTAFFVTRSSRGPVPVSQLLRYARQICLGLQKVQNR